MPLPSVELVEVDSSVDSPSQQVFTPVAKVASKSSLYAIVWRWHFYAGMIVMPVLLFLAVTGALYVFKTELSTWKDRALLFVTPQPKRVSYDRLYEIARQASTSHDIEAMAFTPDAKSSVRFISHVEEPGHAQEKGEEHDERHEWIYLNPYSGEVLGKRIAEEDFFAIVLELHRSLMLGIPGRIVNELVTGWGLVLVATGIYLWWPRGKKNVGVWFPRIKGKLYAILRDWHTVPAAYLSPLIFLVMFTGMFFTFGWGSIFNTSVQKAGHWPKSWGGPVLSATAPEGAQPASLDDVISTFLSRARPDDTVMFRFPQSPKHGYRAFYMQDEDKNSLNMVAVDRYTAQVQDELSARQVPFLYKVRLWAVSIHMGKIFGTPTKILGLLASLAVCGLAITGIWMWWKRRPQGRSGFPRRPEPRSLPAWGWGVVLLTALLLPITGISIILVLLIDFVLGLRRRPSAA